MVRSTTCTGNLFRRSRSQIKALNNVVDFSRRAFGRYPDTFSGQEPRQILEQKGIGEYRILGNEFGVIALRKRWSLDYFFQITISDPIGDDGPNRRPRKLTGVVYYKRG